MVNLDENAKKTILGVLAIGLGMFVYFKYFKKTTQSISKNGVLFVGDSITAIEYNNTPIKTNYPYLIKQELEPKGIKIDVLAVGGKGTKWMLDNLILKLKTNKYDRIYIYGGVNDMFSAVTEKSALDNIQSMVNVANQNGADAFVITGYDTKDFMDEDKLKTTSYVPTKAGMVALKNRYISFQNAIPKTIKNATIVEKFDIPSSMTSDAIHPSTKGQKIIAEILLKDLLKNI